MTVTVSKRQNLYLAGGLVAAVLVAGALFITSQQVNKTGGTGGAPPHVMVVMLENKGYAATLGTCSADPYLCSLASQNASVVGWTGVTHPSEPNYIAATMGSTEGCTSDTCFKTLTVPSLGGELTANGVPWTAYMESMPSACYTGQWAPSGTSGSSAKYGEKHNPFVIVSDVLNNGCKTHVLPYPGASNLVSTLTSAAAPHFVWVTPNQQDDMHSGTVTAGDNWLKANVAPVLASSWFTGGNATVIITMDEHESDSTGGGGSIPLVVISSAAFGKGKVSMVGNHYGLLRSIEEAMNVPLLGAATSSSHGDVSALFGVAATPSPSPSPSPTPTPTPTAVTTGAVVCTGVAQTDTALLTAAVDAGGTVNIAAGTCALSTHLPVNKPETINGAGDTSTFLVQHGAINIFQINVPGVTVENLNLDTYTYNQWPVSLNNPNPGTLFSAKSNTTLHNIISKSNVGFGMRVTGPSPCDAYGTSGTVIDNVTSTNFGKGGFTALDIDCTNGATVTNTVINGDYIALFIDENVVLNGEVYQHNVQNTCTPPIYITGNAANIAISNVTGGGGIIEKPGTGTLTNITQTNVVRSAGC